MRWEKTVAGMGGVGVPLPGDPGVDPGMVDAGGLGAPPVAMPSTEETIIQALSAILQKWDGTQSQIAGEQNALVETLMMIASAQPPVALEAAMTGGDPTGFGMVPEEEIPGAF